MKNLCIIPARAGSQGIPNKNLQKIGDKTLVEWAIASAKESGLFYKVVVSSDSPEILKLAGDNGATPIGRPLSLSGGDILIERIIAHLLSNELRGEEFDTIYLLNPTTPLRSKEDLLSADVFLKQGRYQSVVSVEKTNPVYMVLVRRGKRGLWHMEPSAVGKNRQMRKPLRKQNGALFAVTKDYFTVTGKLIGDKCALVEMPQERSIDIDTPWDLLAARAYYEELKSSGQLS